MTDTQNRQGVSRRNFLTSTAIGTAAVLAAGPLAWAQSSPRPADNRNNQGETKMKTRKLGALEVSEIGAGAMSISANYGPAGAEGSGHRDPSCRIREGRHVLRHRRSLRAVHQRGTGRRSARAIPRQGADRDQVRLQHRRRRRAVQQARAHQEGCRGVTQAPAHRPHRSVLPAPR